MADRISSKFVPFVVCAAIATCIGWAVAGEQTDECSVLTLSLSSSTKACQRLLSCSSAPLGCSSAQQVFESHRLALSER